MITETVYICIGNSDDKLSQASWSQFVSCIQEALQGAVDRGELVIHGSWRSRPDDPWQNACRCVQFPPSGKAIGPLRELLADLAGIYRQDSITWAPAQVEFIKAAP